MGYDRRIEGVKGLGSTAAISAPRALGVGWQEVRFVQIAALRSLAAQQPIGTPKRLITKHITVFRLWNPLFHRLMFQLMAPLVKGLRAASVQTPD